VLVGISNGIVGKPPERNGGTWKVEVTYPDNPKSKPWLADCENVLPHLLRKKRKRFSGSLDEELLSKKFRISHEDDVGSNLDGEQSGVHSVEESSEPNRSVGAFSAPVQKRVVKEIGPTGDADDEAGGAGVLLDMVDDVFSRIDDYFSTY
jgi:hypothetical protein